MQYVGSIDAGSILMAPAMVADGQQITLTPAIPQSCKTVPSASAASL